MKQRRSRKDSRNTIGYQDEKRESFLRLSEKSQLHHGAGGDLNIPPVQETFPGFIETHSATFRSWASTYGFSPWSPWADLPINPQNVIPARFWRESSHMATRPRRGSGFPPKACGNDGQG